MALNSRRVLEMADDIERSSDALKVAAASLEKTLETNTSLAIDWTGDPKPKYIEEDDDQNIAGKNYDRQQVANAIFSLEQVLKALTNQVITQGDHLGNLNQVAKVDPDIRLTGTGSPGRTGR